jgi:hypothetical protein
MTTKELLYDEALVTLSYEIVPSWDNMWPATKEEDFDTFMKSWSDMKFRRKLIKRLLGDPSRSAWVFEKRGIDGGLRDLNIKVRASIDEVYGEADAIVRTGNILQLHPEDYVRYYPEVDFIVKAYNKDARVGEVHILQSRVDKTEIIN